MKIGIVTCGGDAPGMNAAIRGVVRYALNYGIEVEGFYGGYKGIVNNDYIKLNSYSVDEVFEKGGTFLFTERFPEFTDPKVRSIAAKVLKEHKIDSLVCIGGNGTFMGAKLLSNEHGIKVICIPGTIDNDLGYTEYTLGFDTCLSSIVYDLNCIKDTMTSHHRTVIVEAMGNKSGCITLTAGVACGADAIIVPEIPFNKKEVLDKIVSNFNNGKKYNLVLVAEGCISSKDLQQFFKENSSLDVKSFVIGHTQRGGNPTALDRVLATKFAIKAVKLLLDGKTNRVVGIKNNKIIDMDIDEAMSIEPKLDIELYNEVMKLM